MLSLENTVLKRILRLMEFAAAIILMALMIMTCADVIARYFFNRPITGGFELTEAMLACLIFIGLPLVTLRRGHIEIDMMPIPSWMANWHHRVVNVMGAAATGFLAYRLWLRGLQLQAAGETTLQLRFSVSYLAYTMSIFTALTAVAFIILAILPAVARSEQASEI